MKKLKLLFIITISFLSITNSYAQSDNKPITPPAKQINYSSGFADIVEDLLPAVVNISTSQELNVNNTNIGNLFDNLPNGSVFDGLKDLLEKQQAQKKEIASLGSGFIISKDGYVVTNYHVIEGADEIMVILSDGKKIKAKITGVDKKTDLALLKIDSNTDFKFVQLGDSNKSRIGEWVIAVGNPFGLGGSVSAGIISARGRDIASGQLDGFIQTDAAINKGNSGGPMFNLKGEVIGVNTIILSTSGGSMGIGFAIPSSIVKPVIEQLKNKGEIVRGWLGVKIQYVDEKIASGMGLPNSKGALVAEVMKDSPADKAGIKIGDIVTKYDGKEVPNMHKLPRMVADTPIDKKVNIEIFRNGKSQVVSTKIVKPINDPFNDEKEAKSDSEDAEATAGKIIIGLKVADIDKNMVARYKLDTSITGVVITGFDKNAPIADSGLMPGDIIQQVNQTAIKSIKDFEKTINSIKDAKGNSAVLLVHRKGENRFIVIEIE